MKSRDLSKQSTSVDWEIMGLVYPQQHSSYRMFCDIEEKHFCQTSNRRNSSNKAIQLIKKSWDFLQFNAYPSSSSLILPLGFLTQGNSNSRTSLIYIRVERYSEYIVSSFSLCFLNFEGTINAAVCNRRDFLFPGYLSYFEVHKMRMKIVWSCPVLAYLWCRQQSWLHTFMFWFKRTEVCKLLR